MSISCCASPRVPYRLAALTSANPRTRPRQKRRSIQAARRPLHLRHDKAMTSGATAGRGDERVPLEHQTFRRPRARGRLRRDRAAPATSHGGASATAPPAPPARPDPPKTAAPRSSPRHDQPTRGGVTPVQASTVGPRQVTLVIPEGRSSSSCRARLNARSAGHGARRSNLARETRAT